MDVFVKLLGVAMLPVMISVIFYLIKRMTPFGSWHFWVKQITYGVVFGVVAICCTLFGVDIGGATANCRDAGVLCAGFFFGGPAGIIAGLIGGLFRWFSAPVTGMYTRVACTVATMAAGFYAASLRKYVFEFRRPGWLMASLVGVVMEVFHMILVFLTHLDDVEMALEIIKLVTVPMVLCNAFACGLTAFLLEIISRKLLHRHKEIHKKRINDRIQVKMLIAVVAAFILSSALLFLLQTELAVRQAERLMDTSVSDTVNDIKDTIDKDMLNTAHKITGSYERGGIVSLPAMAQTYGLTEIHIVNDDGIIVASNDQNYVGFDMKSGKQSSQFMVLTRGVKELVRPFEQISFYSSDLVVERKYAGVALSDGGFIQIGYDRDKLKAHIREEMEGITENRHIGNTGGIYIIDSDMNLLSATYGSITKVDKDALKEAGKTTVPGQLFVTDINGAKCYCKYGVTEGYYILAYYPLEEAMSARDLEAYINAFLEILIFAMMFGWIFYLIRSIVVDEIYKVNASLRKITEGDLEERVNVHSSQEFDELSDAVNETVERLEQYTQEVQDKINQEIEIAKSIQQSALPQHFDSINASKEIGLYATMTAAREVGGDFYDFELKDDTLYFGIADVSGKGIPGAMFMMRAITTINNCIDRNMTVDGTFTVTNAMLCEGNDAEMFVTAWMGRLNTYDGHVDFANAGHNPPLVYRKGEGYSYLRSKAGFVLAGMDGIVYKHQEIDLDPGDKIFLYTDGVTEAQNVAQELYGEERLLNCLNSHMDADEVETIRIVKEDIDAFVDGAEQFDDITMLVVRYNGPADDESKLDNLINYSV